ncbi:MAG TPA: PAS domain S-box protein [Gemmatimonas sp.]|nr:PAS domain S-box protein [Gemmatimonas sp.]
MWGPALVQIYNDGYRDFMGAKHPAGLGQPTHECFPEASQLLAPVYEQLSRGEPVVLENALIPLVRYGELEDAWFTAAMTPLRDEATGAVAGVFSTFFETTGQVRDKAALSTSEARFRALATTGSDALYRMSPDWSELWQLDGRGFLSDTPATSNEWMPRYVHPGDQTLLRDAIAEAIRERRMFALEHRVVRADGSLGWVSSRAVPLLGAAGEITEWIGAGSDVTARKEAEATLRESQERQAFLLTLSDALRPLLDAVEIQRIAMDLVTQKFGVEMAAYSEYGPDGDRGVLTHVRWGTRTPFSTEVRLSDFGPVLVEAFAAGRAFWYDDLETGPRLEGHREAYRALNIQAGVGIPLVKAGRIAGVLAVNHTEPRRWTDAEVRLLEETAERTWAAVQRARAETALVESEARFRVLVANVPDYAIFLLDASGRVTEWPDGAARVKGYSAEEVLGQHLSVFYTPEEREAGDPERELAEAARTGRAEREGWRVRKDGSRFWVNEVCTAVYDSDGQVAGFTKITRDLTDRRLAEQATKEAERQTAREVLRQALAQAEEAERRRLARELHDQLGQEITALRLGLDDAVRLAASYHGTHALSDAPLLGRLAQLQTLSGHLTASARYIALELRPPELDDLGLESALETYVAEWRTRYDVAAAVAVTGLRGRDIPSDVASALYRIAQEALTNVAKHAGATQVSVIVEQLEGEVRLIIEDDGRGFDLDATAVRVRQERRLGLASMRERAALLGGTWEIESSADRGGTTLYVRLPLPAPATGGAAFQHDAGDRARGPAEGHE